MIRAGSHPGPGASRRKRRSRRLETRWQTVNVPARYEVTIQQVGGALAGMRGRWQAEVAHACLADEGTARQILGRVRARTQPQAIRAGRRLAVELEDGARTPSGSVTNVGPVTVVLLGLVTARRNPRRVRRRTNSPRHVGR
jgi:hypothetical protein